MFFSFSFIYLFDLIVDSISAFYFLSRGLEAMHEIINQFKSEWSVIWMFSEGGIAY